MNYKLKSESILAVTEAEKRQHDNFCHVHDDLLLPVNKKEDSSPFGGFCAFNTYVHCDLDLLIEEAKNTYKLLLPVISDRLRTYTDSPMDGPYWEVLIGPFLYRFIGYILDRRARLNRFIEDTGAREFIGINESCYRQFVSDRDVAIAFNNDPLFNAQIITQLLSEQKLLVGRETIEQSDGGQPIKLSRLKSRNGVRLLRKILWMLARNSDCSYLKGGKRFGYLSWLYAYLKSKGKYALLSSMPVYRRRPAFDFDLRKKIFSATSNIGSETDHIQREVMSCLKHAFPASMLEDYTYCHAQAEELIDNKPPAKVIYQEYHFPNNFLLAALRNRGAKLISIQHGGAYGEVHNHVGEFEQAMADGYITWGWQGGRNTNHPFYGYKLSQLLDNPPVKTADEILHLTTEHTEYPCGLWEQKLIPPKAQYLHRQMAFLDALPPDLRARLLLRTKPRRLSWDTDIDTIFTRRYPDIALQDTSESWKQCRYPLIIIDYYCSTVFLEAITLDQPVVVYGDINQLTSTTEAQPFHEFFFEKGVFQPGPEACAQFIASQWPNLREWWQSLTGDQRFTDYKRKFAAACPGLDAYQLMKFCDSVA